MTQQQVRKRIEEIGIIPAVRFASAADAQFAIEAVCDGGITIVEVTMTVPGAVDIIRTLVRTHRDLVVGAGTIFDAGQARVCLDAGAKFLTTPGLDLEIVDFALQHDTLVFPGVLTPTEITAARKAGADLLKVFPCSLVGGPHYIKALTGPFPDVAFIASGGVNQQTAASFIEAGATALGIGQHLVPEDAIHQRQAHRLHELARRFVDIVKHARSHED